MAATDYLARMGAIMLLLSLLVAGIDVTASSSESTANESGTSGSALVNDSAGSPMGRSNKFSKLNLGPQMLNLQVGGFLLPNKRFPMRQPMPPLFERMQMLPHIVKRQPPFGRGDLALRPSDPRLDHWRKQHRLPQFNPRPPKDGPLFHHHVDQKQQHQQQQQQQQQPNDVKSDKQRLAFEATRQQQTQQQADRHRQQKDDPQSDAKEQKNSDLIDQQNDLLQNHEQQGDQQQFHEQGNKQNHWQQHNDQQRNHEQHQWQLDRLQANRAKGNKQFDYQENHQQDQWQQDEHGQSRAKENKQNHRQQNLQPQSDQQENDEQHLQKHNDLQQDRLQWTEQQQQQSPKQQHDHQVAIGHHDHNKEQTNGDKQQQNNPGSAIHVSADGFFLNAQQQQVQPSPVFTAGRDTLFSGAVGSEQPGSVTVAVPLPARNHNRFPSNAPFQSDMTAVMPSPLRSIGPGDRQRKPNRLPQALGAVMMPQPPAPPQPLHPHRDNRFPVRPGSGNLMLMSPNGPQRQQLPAHQAPGQLWVSTGHPEPLPRPPMMPSDDAARPTSDGPPPPPPPFTTGFQGHDPSDSAIHDPSDIAIHLPSASPRSPGQGSRLPAQGPVSSLEDQQQQRQRQHEKHQDQQKQPPQVARPAGSFESLRFPSNFDKGPWRPMVTKQPFPWKPLHFGVKGTLESTASRSTKLSSKTTTPTPMPKPMTTERSRGLLPTTAKYNATDVPSMDEFLEELQNLGFNSEANALRNEGLFVSNAQPQSADYLMGELKGILGSESTTMSPSGQHQWPTSTTMSSLVSDLAVLTEPTQPLLSDLRTLVDTLSAGVTYPSGVNATVPSFLRNVNRTAATPTAGPSYPSALQNVAVRPTSTIGIHNDPATVTSTTSRDGWYVDHLGQESEGVLQHRQFGVANTDAAAEDGDDRDDDHDLDGDLDSDNVRDAMINFVEHLPTTSAPFDWSNRTAKMLDNDAGKRRPLQVYLDRQEQEQEQHLEQQQQQQQQEQRPLLMNHVGESVLVQQNPGMPTQGFPVPEEHATATTVAHQFNVSQEESPLPSLPPSPSLPVIIGGNIASIPNATVGFMYTVEDQVPNSDPDRQSPSTFNGRSMSGTSATVVEHSSTARYDADDDDDDDDNEDDGDDRDLGLSPGSSASGPRKVVVVRVRRKKHQATTTEESVSMTSKATVRPSILPTPR